MEEFTANIQLSDFARRLRRLRLDKGLSTSEAAKACGLQIDAIARYELDKQTPSLASLTALANYFKRHLFFFLKPGFLEMRSLYSKNLRKFSVAGAK